MWAAKTEFIIVNFKTELQFWHSPKKLICSNIQFDFVDVDEAKKQNKWDMLDASAPCSLCKYNSLNLRHLRVIEKQKPTGLDEHSAWDQVRNSN